MPICKGARVKIKRANQHIRDLETCIDGLKKRLVTNAHTDPNTGYEYIKCDFASGFDIDEVLDNISGIIGDAVHNLKSALDHVWFETCSRLMPSTSWEKEKFPAFHTADGLKLALRKLQVHTSSPNFYRFVVGQIKPYDGGDWAIRTVHKLDIRDKHRLLIPAIYYSSIGNIYMEDEHGETQRGDTWSTSKIPYYVNFDGSVHVKDPGGASIDVMFQEGDTGTETRAPDTRKFYSAHFFMIVELFEHFIENP